MKDSASRSSYPILLNWIKKNRAHKMKPGVSLLTDPPPTWAPLILATKVDLLEQARHDHLGFDQRARVMVRIEGGKWKLAK